MEARAVQAEQERDEVIWEMIEMAQLLAQHFGVYDLTYHRRAHLRVLGLVISIISIRLM